MARLTQRRKLIIWQLLFVWLGTSWLLAPSLNHHLSYRVSLISQYETGGQPYSWVFRLGDLIAGAMLTGLVLRWARHRFNTWPAWLLLIIGLGIMADPVFTTSCDIHGQVCKETVSLQFILHAIETFATGVSVAILTFYDAWRRQRLVSIGFALFQVAYVIFFIGHYASQGHFNTASQYVYQLAIIIWLAWYVRDFFLGDDQTKLSAKHTSIVRYIAAAWTLLNGLLAIIISLAHIHLLGRIMGLYFAGNSGAWLAQHGVIVGVIMIYLSRHILRGERRARQILLAIVATEVLKYAVITPNLPLVLVYSFTFGFIFVAVDDFKRGVVPMTWQLRLKDLAYMVIALLVSTLTGLLVLSRNSRVSRVTAHALDNFSDYALHAGHIRITHRDSVLLAHTITAFLLASLAAILWILFRPYKVTENQEQDDAAARQVLTRWSDSSEDYFKLWPTDKQLFWNSARGGFLAYRVVGPVAFALADPIGPPGQRQSTLKEFTEFCRAHRLRACCLPIYESNLPLYKDMASLQVGASALIDVDKFLDETVKDKWWRWKRNRASKQGYEYAVSQPPHSGAFLQQLKTVSDDWMATGGHDERGFALGYFDEGYLQACRVHFLKDQVGKVVAFTNQLPNLRRLDTTTVDLLRWSADSADPMPYLLSKVIESAQGEGYKRFDLGFVPFAGAKGPIQSVARTLSAGRFSAKGLEQFKNKFQPNWQDIYLAYDGDLADLALIAVHVEAAMKLNT